MDMWNGLMRSLESYRSRLRNYSDKLLGGMTGLMKSQGSEEKST